MVTLGTSSSRRPAGWFDAIAASPRPAVVDYAAAGERVELSGRVLANWAAKTANLLDAEGYGPGTAVALDLAVGWKQLAVLLGAARAGVEVVFAPGAEVVFAPGAEVRNLTPELAVTDAPEAWAEAPADLWAVSPDAPLPPHALDYSTEVRVQGDQCPLPMPTGSLAELAAGWQDTAGGAAAAGSDARWSRRARGLVVAAHGGRLDGAVARAVVGAWGAGLPVVVVPAERAEADGVARLVAAERLDDAG